MNSARFMLQNITADYRLDQSLRQIPFQPRGLLSFLILFLSFPFLYSSNRVRDHILLSTHTFNQTQHSLSIHFACLLRLNMDQKTILSKYPRASKHPKSPTDNTQNPSEPPRGLSLLIMALPAMALLFGTESLVRRDNTLEAVRTPRMGMTSRHAVINDIVPDSDTYPRAS